MEKATLAGGCFWGIQLDFDKVDGVTSTVVGYTGGTMDNPTYEDICTGKTQHAEAIEITYDPGRISFAELLDIFWTIHNPTTLNQQGPDRGSQYRSAIFYHSPHQKDIALDSLRRYDASDLWRDPIVTEIIPVTAFWPAEEYHQKYLEKRGQTISCH